MGYHDDIHEKIVSEGMDKTPEYVKKKIDDYQQIANINYRLYKNAKTKKERAVFVCSFAECLCKIGSVERGSFDPPS